jgi:hypothetical protein
LAEAELLVERVVVATLQKTMFPALGQGARLMPNVL